MAKPIPLPDPETAPFWQAAQRSELVAQHCDACGHAFLPPRPRCPSCHAAKLSWKVLSGRGKIHSYCITRMPLVTGFEPPYVVAVVELDDLPGSRLNANILDCAIEAVRIDMPVEVVFERRSPEVVVPQYRPSRAGLDG